MPMVFFRIKPRLHEFFRIIAIGPLNFDSEG